MRAKLNGTGIVNPRLLSLNNMSNKPSETIGHKAGYTLVSTYCPHCGAKMNSINLTFQCDNHIAEFEGWSSISSHANGKDKEVFTQVYQLQYKYEPHQGRLELLNGGEYSGFYPLPESHSIIDIIR